MPHALSNDLKSAFLQSSCQSAAACPSHCSGKVMAVLKLLSLLSLMRSASCIDEQWRPASHEMNSRLTMCCLALAMRPLESCRYTEDVRWIGVSRKQAKKAFNIVVYQSSDHKAPNFVPNRGYEATKYLKFIIDHCHSTTAAKGDADGQRSPLLISGLSSHLLAFTFYLLYFLHVFILADHMMSTDTHHRLCCIITRHGLSLQVLFLHAHAKAGHSPCSAMTFVPRWPWKSPHQHLSLPATFKTFPYEVQQKLNSST